MRQKGQPMLNELPHFLYYDVAITGANTVKKPHNYTYFCAKENLFHAKKGFRKCKSKML